MVSQNLAKADPEGLRNRCKNPAPRRRFRYLYNLAHTGTIPLRRDDTALTEVDMPETSNRTGDRLLSWRDVRARVPLSRATIWALRRRGTFPKPIQISPNRIAWRESELSAWIAERQSAGREA